MKKQLILSLIILVVLFGFSTLVFATTATPAITTIAGDASGGTVYINTAEKAGIIVVGTITASTTASTTVWTVFKDGTTNYATTTGLASGDAFMVTTTNGSSLADGSGISLQVYAQTGDDATSTAATKTSIVLDTAVPTLSKITMYTNNSSTTVAKVGDIVYLTASSSEAIGSPTVTLFGSHSDVAVTISNIADNGWMASTTMISSDTAGLATFTMAFNDLAGNSGVSTTTLNVGIFPFYYTAPTISISGYNPLKCAITWICADDGATAVDSRGVSVTLSTLSTVSTSTVGYYTRSYGGVDLAGNAATSTRDVYVVKRSTTYSEATSNTDTTNTTDTIVTVPSSATITPVVTVNPVIVQSPVVSVDNNTPTTVVQVSGIADSINRQLKSGISGDDVKLIQTLLSHDSSVYPEALTTGYFGALTQKAIQRFQVKYNLASEGVGGYGEVGPKTKAKLIEIYGQ